MAAIEKVFSSLRTVVYMFISAAVFIAFVSTVYLLTKDTIAFNRTLNLKKSLLTTAGLYTNLVFSKNLDPRLVTTLFDIHVSNASGQPNADLNESAIFHIYKPKNSAEAVVNLIKKSLAAQSTDAVNEYPDNKKTLPKIPVTYSGFVLKQQGPGLWGEIEALVGFATNETVSGIEFIKQSETPGLGARISETWFKEQFRGKKGLFSTVPEGAKSSQREFEAITGATITTRGVKQIINDAYRRAVKNTGK